MPFLAPLKPPMGVKSVEEAFPKMFEERIGKKEALVNECQLVLLPNVGDQIINARMMSASMKVGVEVEKEDQDGLFTRENVCKAVRTVMEEGDEVGKEVRANKAKLRLGLMLVY
ncbi:hypothetical protein Vadar_032084 [Vaccinium darrowii]|uniref:Uncharacterized protein n=2 Tax=Vaccinium darrowii TaxID=229202 RepID=A0ACB7Z7D5_9ERIC|nr:hypothetical protein Vadar_019393 [Vaccinium darrowii]KAH7861877.1 hypothetical protein Vadar_032084 [Vaccinium darrowii]